MSEIEQLKTDIRLIMGTVLILAVVDLVADINIWSDINQLKAENAELREAAQYFYDFEEI